MPPVITKNGPLRAQGDPDPDFAAWFAREYPRVRAALTLAVGDRALAEEATAEAFARALVRWPALAREGTPSAWVYVVALNQVRSWLRRARLERRHLSRQSVEHQAPPVEPEPALWSAVAALPERARTAVALRYVADLTEPQVAAAMGVTRGAVAAMLHNARRQLARNLSMTATNPTNLRGTQP